VLETGLSRTRSAWGEIFGDEVTAAAMIDRLVHHAEILALKGDSYRLKRPRPRPTHAGRKLGPPGFKTAPRQAATPAHPTGSPRRSPPRTQPEEGEFSTGVISKGGSVFNRRNRVNFQAALTPRARRVTLDTVLGETVSGLLARRWSPEQVTHELRERFVGERARVAVSGIDLSGVYDAQTLFTRPVCRRRRRRRLLGLQRRGRLTAMRMISERPVEANDRR
jgi:hypothetical protein